MSRVNTFGKTWWGEKWIEALEKIDMDTNRLPRGRTYANNGSVRNIEIKKIEVQAKVKGRLPSPYSVRIKFEPR